MAGVRIIEDQLRLTIPYTFNALTKLVMAMADVAKNAGKRTFFGRDKGQASYSEFLRALKVTVHSMVLDRVVQESTPTDEVARELEEKLQKFAMAFPNWQDAYGFAAMFFGEERKNAIATIERIRSMS
jgi:hypothetical protein